MNNGGKRAAILKATEALIMGHMLQEVTVEQVARAAHVSKGTIYTYFKDKDELFFQLVNEGFEELCSRLGECATGSSAFEERVLAGCREVSKFFVKRRPLMRILTAQEGVGPGLRREMRDRWLQRRQLMVKAMAAILRPGQEEGELRQDLSSETLAEMLLGMMRARGRRVMEFNNREELLSIEQVVDLFMSGAVIGGRAATTA